MVILLYISPLRGQARAVTTFGNLGKNKDISVQIVKLVAYVKIYLTKRVFNTSNDKNPSMYNLDSEAVSSGRPCHTRGAWLQGYF